MDGDPPRPVLPVGWTPDPIPESVTIPAALVEAWHRIDAGATVAVEFRRGDFDRFYQAMNKGLLAQSDLQQSLIEYSRGDLAEANRHMHRAQRAVVESQNDLRQLMTAIMASAVLPKVP
jgi:hypothetical protein